MILSCRLETRWRAFGLTGNGDSAPVVDPQGQVQTFAVPLYRDLLAA